MVAGPNKMPRSHMAWLGAASLCGILAIVFYMLYISGGEAERARAVSEGQRLLVNLATGEIEGKMQQLFPDELPDDRPTAADGELDENGMPIASAADPVDRPAPVKPKNDADLYAEFTAGLEQTMHGEEPAPREVADEEEAANEEEGEENTLARAAEPKKQIPIFPRTVASLEPANQTYMQNSPSGMLPDRGPKDTMPWKFYARKTTAPADATKIAVAITDLGAHHAYGKEALTLPQDVTFIFTDYSPDAPTWLESARNRGHEAWLQLPVEMKNFPAADPGPMGLTTNLSQAETMQRLHQNLARLQAYVGVYFPTNDRFTKQGILMQVVLNDIRARGLLALIGNRETVADWAQKFRTTVLPRATHITPPYDAELLARNLESIERKVISDRSLILTVEPTPLALDALKKWLPTLQEKGITLVPLSAMVPQQ